ncbi:MAG: hypothetical protein IT355_06535 [Gemmatimonadaceae bacterium]|nr:hypothetical protein [Gemmatimonadaceae bacterium]
MPAHSRRSPLLPPRGAALLPLTLGSLLSGCYTYRAAPPGALVAGSEVRLTLTTAGARALTDSAGLRIRTLEGRLQLREPDGALVVLPTEVTTIDGDALPWRRGALTVPSQALDGSAQRTVNRRRSIGVAAGIAGVFTGVVVFAFRSIWGRGGSSVSPGPGTPE